MSPHHRFRALQPLRSRRALLGAALQVGLGGAALYLVAPMGASTGVSAGRTPDAGRTWLLTTAEELRPPPPSARDESEFDEVRALQAARSDATDAAIQRWGSGSAVLPWTDIALDLIQRHRPSPPRAARALAVLHTALSDAVLAVWDAKAAYERPAPAVIEPRISLIGATDPQLSAFPSAHAAVAAAAVAILTALFPEEPVRALAALEDEAVTSRLRAGAASRSDVEAGVAIGHAVGARAIARARADRADAVWDGAGRPSGPGVWQPTPPGFVDPPLEPLAGTWATWVIERGSQFRASPPPVYGSPAWQVELAAVQEAIVRRTPAQEAAVHFWAGGAGTVTPAGLWIEIARDLIRRDGLDPPRAARVLALTSVAMADAFICCWDTKYAYWTARPVTADPSLNVLIPTPPFPSYTSGHSTISAAAASVLGHLFPEDEAELAAQAEAAKNSRLWAGIHFPIDNEMGKTAGSIVGRLIAFAAP